MRATWHQIDPERDTGHIIVISVPVLDGDRDTTRIDFGKILKSGIREQWSGTASSRFPGGDAMTSGHGDSGGASSRCLPRQVSPRSPRTFLGVGSQGLRGWLGAGQFPPE